MKIVRLAGLVSAAIMAVSLVAVSAAFAAPEFNPSSKVLLLGTSATSTLSAGSGTENVSCATDTSHGEITSATLAGNITVHFLNCKGTNAAGATCLVKSEGAPTGNLIITKTLHGLLGLVLGEGTNSASDVGLLLLPGSGKQFVTLQGSCLAGGETIVTGLVAGLLEPIGKLVHTAKLVLTVKGTSQAITDIDVSGGSLVTPKLTAFSTGATEQATEEILFDGPLLEVT